MEKAKEKTGKRKLILEAALKMIADRGFHAAPMSKIAKNAGVAAGTIYHYFDSKNDMITALFWEINGRMKTAMKSKEVAEGKMRQRFLRQWAALFDFFIEHPAEFMFLEQFANSPFLATRPGDETATVFYPFQELLSHGLNHGLVRKAAPQLLSAIAYSSVSASARLHLSGSLLIQGKNLQDALYASWDSMKPRPTMF